MFISQRLGVRGFFIVIDIVAAILPTFCLIVCGYFLKEHCFKQEEFWLTAEKLAYFVFFPALLIKSLGDTSMTELVGFTELISSLLFSVVATAFGLVVLQRLCKMEVRFFTSVFQGCVRYSTYILISISSALYGEEGVELASSVIPYMIITSNIFSVIVHHVYIGSEFSYKHILKSTLQNPLIISSLIGISISISGLPIPSVLYSTLSYLAAAALPLSLLCLGASLMFVFNIKSMMILNTVASYKLIIFPLICSIIMKFAGVSGINYKIGLLFASMPCASTAYILSRQLGGDTNAIATIITISTILSMVTIPIVIGMF